MLNVPIEIWEESIKNKKPKAYFNFLRSLEERSKNAKIVRSRPYLLYLDPVSYCNLECPFCETGKRRGSREAAKLPLDNFKKVIDELGDYIFDLTLYNWGEPLLNKDLPEMIQYAKKYSIFTQLSSNLSITLKEEQISKLISSGLDLLICSIDGASQKTYEKYRVGGNFELVIKNIKLFNKLKKELNKKNPYLLWRFFVFRHNEHEIEIAKKLARELNIEIKFARPYIGDSAKTDEWVSTIEPYSNNVVSKGDQTVGNTDKILNKKGTLQKNNYNNCGWLWSTMVVNSNYSISPCCGIHLEKNDFGKLEYPVEDFWNNKNYKIARESFSNKAVDKEVICTRCPVPEIQQMNQPYDEAILKSFQKIFPTWSQHSKELFQQELTKMNILDKNDLKWHKILL